MLQVRAGFPCDGHKGGDLPLVTGCLRDDWRSMSDAEVAARQKLKVAALDAWLNPGKVDADKLKPCCDALKDVNKNATDAASGLLGAFYAK